MASSTVNSRELPVIVVTGTSGAGKGTLEAALMPRVPELAFAVSATTRARREGEEEGREYYFVSEEEFQRMLDAGEFLEHVDFAWGQRVGTLWSEIARIRGEGRAPLLDLETDGALVVKRQIDDCVTIFVRAPSFDELERRLRERATESGGEIEKRLERAKRQLEQQDEFDYVIVNDDLARAADELFEIVHRELSAAGTMAS
ncbi:MAG: guanylate kinase [Actinobacteria bacterium]|nr:MAG: guanylate kinase [Actinomycetota bacterium]